MSRDAVIVSTARTPLTKAARGAFNNTTGATLGAWSIKAAVERACIEAKALGAKRALPLAVSAPFHSPLLKPAGDKLAVALSAVKLNSPRFPVVNNIDVAAEVEPARIVDALIRQSYGPVRWVEVIRKLRQMGVTHLIEFGPGKVLSGLAPRIDKDLKASAVYDPTTLAAVLAEVRA